MAGVKVQRDKNFIPDNIWKKIRKNRYEKGEREAAVKIAKKGDVVLELGSGIGLTAAVLAKNTAVSKVVAFEANPALIPFANSLVQENGITNVEYRNAILSNSTSQNLDFYVREPFWSSSLDPGPKPYTEKIIVPVQNANDCINDIKPDIIISDIEGGEIDFFSVELELKFIRAIVLEIHPKKTGVEPVNAMLNILRDRGFVNELKTSKPNVIALMREPL